MQISIIVLWKHDLFLREKLYKICSKNAYSKSYDLFKAFKIGWSAKLKKIIIFKVFISGEKVSSTFLLTINEALSS